MSEKLRVVYEYVEANPGAVSSQVAAGVGLKWGAARKRLRMLVLAGYLHASCGRGGGYMVRGPQ